MIRGASGSGKSTLALQLLALGCTLVADDRTDVYPDLTVSCPTSISGLVEARGIGLLKAEHVDAKLVLVVDLDHTETDRLPQKQTASIHGNDVDLIYKVDGTHFAYALLQYLKVGRQEPE